MGFVRDDRPDIFISYARGDDRPDDEGEAGWVTTLKRLLEKRLFRPLGQDCDVWMDHRLATGSDLSAELEDRVRASAVLLIVLSPGYLRSSWCVREMELFLDEVAKREQGTASRVFVIELDRVESPAPLQGVLRLRFWAANPDDPDETSLLGSPRPDPKDPEHKPYYKRLDSLASDLAAELKRLKAATPAAAEDRRVPQPSPATPRATVFLAQATEDVDDPYEEVRDYLTQAGFRVVPRGAYPTDEASFRAAALADLRESTLFIQLLGSLPGRKLEGSAKGYVAVQHECALEASPRGGLLRWRNPDLAIDRVADVSHRDRLNEAGVFAMPLSGFKDLIAHRLEEVLKPPPAPVDRPSTPLNKVVFVNADEPDFEVAEQLRIALDRIGAWAELPYEIRTAANPREYLSERIKECDALLIVYGKTRDTWVNGQFRLSRLPLLERPRRAGVAMVEVPPVPKDPLSFRPPNLKVFRGDPLPSEVELLEFLSSL